MLDPVAARTQESRHARRGPDRRIHVRRPGPRRVGGLAASASPRPRPGRGRGEPGLHGDVALLSAAVWIGCGALLVLRARPSGLVLLTGAMLLAQGLAPAVDTAPREARRRGSAGSRRRWPSAWPWSPRGPPRRAVRAGLAALGTGGFVVWELATVLLGPLAGTADVVGGLSSSPASVSRSARRSIATGGDRPAMRARMKWVVYGLTVAIAIELARVAAVLRSPAGPATSSPPGRRTTGSRTPPTRSGCSSFRSASPRRCCRRGCSTSTSSSPGHWCTAG